jgi:hypothetical protein
MEAIYLLQDIRIIQLDIAKTYEAVRMFVDEPGGVRKAVWGCQQKSQAISRIQFVEELFEDLGFAVVMYVNVDELGDVGLRQHRQGRQEQNQSTQPSGILPHRSSFANSLPALVGGAGPLFGSGRSHKAIGITPEPFASTPA